MSVCAHCPRSFGCLLSLTVGGGTGMGDSAPGLQRWIYGVSGFPMGLLMCHLLGAELFTSNAAFLPIASYENRLQARRCSIPRQQRTFAV